MLFALTEPFRQGIMQRALIEVVVLGAVCGPLGAWIVAFRRGFAAESLAHAMLPGLVVAALVGAPIAAGAAVGATAGAGAMALAGRDRRIGPDVGVAVTVTALFGAGALLALAPQAPPRLEELLFGDLLGVGRGDIALSAVLAVAVLAALAAGHRSLTLVAFDPAMAPVLGARPQRVELGLLAVLALTVVATVTALGTLLVVALLVAPAVAARRLGRGVAEVLVLSTLLAITAGVAGLLASYYLSVAAGAAVALAAILCLPLSLIAPDRHAPPPPLPPSPADGARGGPPCAASSRSA